MFARSVRIMALVALVVTVGCRRPSKPPTAVFRPAAKVGPTVVLSAEPKVGQRLGVTFGKEIVLTGFNVSPSPIIKGKPAMLEGVWKCLRKPSRNWTIWTHVDYMGTPGRRLNGDHYPATATSKWQPGKYYVDRLAFVMPKDFKGGVYSVSLGPYFVPPGYPRGTPLVHLTETLSPGSQKLGALSVAFSAGEEQPAMTRGESKEPSVAERLSVTFGNEFQLVGYTIKPSPGRKGKSVSLEIVWKCLAKPTRNWTVWTHIDYLGKPGLRIHGDHYPALPTGLWEPGKYYTDKVDCEIPSGSKPGKYRVSIGPYLGGGQPSLALPEKVAQGGKRYGTLEVGFSEGK